MCLLEAGHKPTESGEKGGILCRFYNIVPEYSLRKLEKLIG